MKLISLALFTLFSLQCYSGELLLIGGGGRPLSILQKVKELSKGKVLMVPLASEIPSEVSASLKSDLSKVGIISEDLSCGEEQMDEAICLEQIQKASLIFFTGGSQSRLLAAFKGTKALELILKRSSFDLNLAGTSAGTAIMSLVMLTGNPLPPYKEIKGVRPKMVETQNGFGIVKKMILDQHFFARQREDRLMSAVLDRPNLVGVGIDEATAIHIHPDESFEVIGDSKVMVLDARKAKISVDASGNYLHQAVEKMILTSGQRYQFD